MESERLLREELRKRSTNSFKKTNELARMREFNVHIPSFPTMMTDIIRIKQQSRTDLLPKEELWVTPGPYSDHY